MEHEPKEVLIKSEVNTLFDLWENGDLPGYLHNTLTFFLGACYTGGDYETFQLFSMANVTQTADGGTFVYKRVKSERTSGKIVRVPITERCVRIFKDIDRRALRVISTQRFNDYLKQIMKIADIEKSMSTHCGRHSFAVIHLNELGTPMEMVSDLLGHSSINITRKHYARFLDSAKRTQMRKFDE